MVEITTKTIYRKTKPETAVTIACPTGFWFIRIVKTPRGYTRVRSCLAAVVSVMLFNFLFTDPRYTFVVNDPQYLIIFPVLFTVALITSELVNRMKGEAQAADIREQRTEVLYRISRSLLQASRHPGSDYGRPRAPLWNFQSRDGGLPAGEGLGQFGELSSRPRQPWRSTGKIWPKLRNSRESRSNGNGCAAICCGRYRMTFARH